MHKNFTTTTRGLDCYAPHVPLYEKARNQPLDEINRATEKIIAAEDA